MTRIEHDYSEAPSPAYYATAYHPVATMVRARGGLNVVNAGIFRETGPAILTSHHDKMLDPQAIGVAYPRALYSLGKQELLSAKYFWIGRFAQPLGMIAIDRDAAGHNIMRTQLKILKAGHSLLSFYQGTRKSTQPKDGVAWTALMASQEDEVCPVYPIGHTTPEAGLMQPVQLVVGEPIYSDDRGGTGKSARKALTLEIETAVQELRAQALNLHQEGAGRAHRITFQSNPARLFPR